MKKIAFIPVRGGSKSIPLKNIKKINGRPLVYWTIDAAVQCGEIDEVIVSTDSTEIKKVVNEYDREDFGKLRCINRDPLNASDTATTESVLIEFTEKLDKESKIILIQATSPLLQSSHLEEALQIIEKNNYDSLVSMVKQKRFIWKQGENGLVSPINYSLSERPRRQEFNGYLVENGAFYISSSSLILETKLRVSGKIGYYEMPPETYFEIDEISDWMIVESFLKEAHKKDFFSKISKIKLLATDCDGVLTDAGMYYSKEGDVLKKFNTKDGMGLSLLQKKGIILAIITGENSEIVKRRAEKLGISECFLGCKDKVAIMDELIDKYHLTYNEVAYIGDDINDQELLQKVGISFSVNDAVDIIKESVDYVAKRNGGDGAVREISDLILKYKA